MQTIPRPVSGYGRFKQQCSEGDAKKLLDLWRALGETEREKYQAACAAEGEASGFSAAAGGLKCINCFCRSVDPAATGWTCLPEAFARSHAEAAFGKQEFVDTYNVEHGTAAPPVTIETAPSVMITAEYLSRYNRSWFCHKCPGH